MTSDEDPVVPWVLARLLADPEVAKYLSDLRARSVDMEARIRALADEWERHHATCEDCTGSYAASAHELRALLDAAPAGGAEVERLRSVIDGTETVIHAPSEVPHD